MNKNYTISSLRALQELPKLDTVQFTLNGRQYPSKRRAVDMLKELTPYHSAEVIVHYDFIYIASRFAMFTDEVKSAIADEVAGILSYADTNDSILGIVMHTDFPLAKEVISGKKRVEDHYAGSLWNTSKISDKLSQWKDLSVVEDGIVEFYTEVKRRYKGYSKVYLENTTKCPKGVNMVDWLMEFIKEYHMYDIFGLCIDTEHAFASSAMTLLNCETYLKEHNNPVSLMYHINAIPSSVAPLSQKDRHSETTIFECSQNTIDQYFKFTDKLDSLGIPWVREVHEETMYKELNLLHEHKLKNALS